MTRLSIPIAEFVQFIFVIENMSIAFREQLVRSRTNAYWLQSGRILDYTKFFEDEMFRIPNSIEALKDGSGKEKDLYNRYMDYHKEAQDLYTAMTEGGIPRQDAREHLGVNTLHRGSMTISMRHLITMMSRRSCWIAYGEHWHPFVRDVTSELRKELGNAAEGLLRLPCSPANEHRGCQYNLENKRRLSGDDPLPVCPLWLCNDQCKGNKERAIEIWKNKEQHLDKKDPDLPQNMMRTYFDLWERDMFTSMKMKGSKLETYGKILAQYLDECD